MGLAAAVATAISIVAPSAGNCRLYLAWRDTPWDRAKPIFFGGVGFACDRSRHVHFVVAWQLSLQQGMGMAKNQNTFEKRRREVEKRFKAEEKRKNRLKRKTDGPEVVTPTEQPESSEEKPEDPA